MSFIYKSNNGGLVTIDSTRLKALMTKESDPSFDKFVAIDALCKDEIIDQSVLLGGSVGAMRLLAFNSVSGSAIQIEGPTRDTDESFYGVSIEAGSNNQVIQAVTKGAVAALISDYNIPKGSMLVGAPDGKVAAYQSAAIQLLLDGASTGEFDNSVWASGGEVINVATSIDESGAQGAQIVCLFINELGEYDVELIILDSANSSTVVSGSKLCTAIVGVYSDRDISTDLYIMNASLSRAWANSVSVGTIYGKIDTTSADAYGQIVEFYLSGPITGKIVVVGTDGNDQIVSEVVSFNAESRQRTVRGWKSVTDILAGDDGLAGVTFTLQVDANTDADIIGYASYEDLVALTTCLIELRSPITLGVDVNGREVVLGVLGSMTAGDASIYGIGSLGINTTTGAWYRTNTSYKWAV